MAKKKPIKKKPAPKAEVRVEPAVDWGAPIEIEPVPVAVPVAAPDDAVTKEYFEAQVKPVVEEAKCEDCVCQPEPTKLSLLDKVLKFLKL